MLDQIIQKWYKCSKKLPTEPGEYLIYIPEQDQQFVAEFVPGFIGKDSWMIHQFNCPPVTIPISKSDNIQWTFGTRYPNEEDWNDND